MKALQSLLVITAFALNACTNNNQNTGGIDSASVSTDPGMRADTNAGTDTLSSDSTDIRFPMADTSKGQKQGSDSTQY